MSAAEPVDPPGIMTNARDAAIIDISTRGRTAAKGRWKDVNSRPDRADQPDRPTNDLQAQAESIEMTFNENHLTLSDDDTAAAYTITLGITRHLLRGAHAKGIVDQQQLERLDALVAGILDAPRLV
jgi:hypothetical protein